jgi:outer membrane protein assembly factor BamE (lipoprotein component of BamABCDE complex)
MKSTAVSMLTLALATACATLPNAQSGRSDALFARVHAGESRAEVEGLLGPPDTRVRFDRSGNEGWDYRYQDGWGYMAIYSITFSPDGRVLSSISNRINSGGDMH